MADDFNLHQVLEQANCAKCGVIHLRDDSFAANGFPARTETPHCGLATTLLAFSCRGSPLWHTVRVRTVCALYVRSIIVIIEKGRCVGLIYLVFDQYQQIMIHIRRKCKFILILPGGQCPLQFL